MATAVERIYLGRDNTINLLLKADGVAQDLTNVTQIDVVIDDKTTSSTNQVTDLIRWVQTGYETGEIRLSFGTVALSASTVQKPAYVIVYDISHDDGIVWGSFPVKILDV